MTIESIKEKLEKRWKKSKEDIIHYEISGNQELRVAAKTIRVDCEEQEIIIGALAKQIPMQANYEYDDEFTCPSCGYEEDDGDVITTMKFCPDCGQKLKWD